MAGVRLRQALAAGFVLIRRRPVAVFASGVLLALFVQASIFFFLGRAAPEFLPLLGGLGPAASQAAAWLVPAGLTAAVLGAISAVVITPWASAYQRLNLRPAMRA